MKKTFLERAKIQLTFDELYDILKEKYDLPDKHDNFYFDIDDSCMQFYLTVNYKIEENIEVAAEKQVVKIGNSKIMLPEGFVKYDREKYADYRNFPIWINNDIVTVILDNGRILPPTMARKLGWDKFNSLPNIVAYREEPTDFNRFVLWDASKAKSENDWPLGLEGDDRVTIQFQTGIFCTDYVKKFKWNICDEFTIYSFKVFQLKKDDDCEE